MNTLQHTLIAIIIMGFSTLTGGCSEDSDGSDPDPTLEFLAGYMPSDPCAEHQAQGACDAAGGSCQWQELQVKCPEGTDCPSGYCATDTACNEHRGADACVNDAANGCAWAHRNRLCLGNHECEDAGGFCYQESLGDGGGECACLCPLYCEGNDCATCECDCEVQKQNMERAGGGTCSCECPPCGPGEKCEPCDCDCRSSSGAGNGACVDDGTCLCLCEGDVCNCECNGQVGSDADEVPVETCECPACDGSNCEPCSCDGDACGRNGTMDDCDADDGCHWQPLDLGCDGSGACRNGVCRADGAASDECTCACEGAACTCDCSEAGLCEGS